MLPDTDGDRADTSLPGVDAAAVPPGQTAARSGLFWWLSLMTVLLDQAVKAAVAVTMPLYTSRPIVPGLIDLVHVRNTGVAFGLLNDVQHASKGLLTTSLAVIALAGIAYYARHIRAEERLARLGLSLILGGAAGNLVDRLRQGYVIDFVDVYWRGWHFWAFNVADAAITAGAVLVLFDLLFMSRHVSHPV